MFLIILILSSVVGHAVHLFPQEEIRLLNQYLTEKFIYMQSEEEEVDRVSAIKQKSAFMVCVFFQAPPMTYFKDDQSKVFVNFVESDWDQRVYERYACVVKGESCDFLRVFHFKRGRARLMDLLEKLDAQKHDIESQALLLALCIAQGSVSVSLEAIFIAYKPPYNVCALRKVLLQKANKNKNVAEYSLSAEQKTIRSEYSLSRKDSQDSSEEDMLSHSPQSTFSSIGKALRDTVSFLKRYVEY